MKGKLIIIERLRNTAMGNPRFLCMVDGTICRTIPNHCTDQGMKEAIEFVENLKNIWTDEVPDTITQTREDMEETT